jgi:Flp pilus assembly protein TadD
VLRAMGWLADTTGIFFPFWLRLPGILADAGSLWLVWRLLGSRVAEPSIRWAALMLAASPVTVLVSGFHGNTDGVMIFFVLLSAYLTETGRSGWAAGAAFGLAMSFKVVPVIAAPVMLLSQPDRWRRVTFLGALLLVLGLGWSPFLFEDPVYVLGKVFGYRSYSGHWGLSFFTSELARLGTGWAFLNRTFSELGAYLLLVVIAALSVWMNRSIPRPSLYVQLGMVFFTFLALSNAFGVQYLAWVVQWTAGLGALPAAVFHVTSGAFLFLVYNYWSEGFPWYLADSNRIGDWRGHLDYFQVLCWLSVVFLAWVSWRQMRRGETTSLWPFRVPAQVSPLVVVAIAGAFVGFPMARQLRRDATAFERTSPEHALLAIRANQYVDLSYQAYRLGRLDDAIKAANQAVSLGPDSADGYNNLAASYASLGMWDAAIDNALHALRIRPDYPLARSNLEWARREKANASAQRAGQSANTPDPATPEYFLGLSVQHYQAGRFDESIAAAARAVTLKPDMAEAHNNLAAGLASLGKWDEAIAEAREALQLKPDFALARNNLAWALEQKRLQRAQASSK